MRLSRRKCFPAVLTILLACDDGTAPPAILGTYVLESIGGQPLPVTVPTGTGYATTVFWSTLNLDASEHAVLTERSRLASPGDPGTEKVYTQRYSYRVTGASIAFEYSPPCPPNALCVAPPTGKLDGSTLILSYGQFTHSRPPSLYRVAGPD